MLPARLALVGVDHNDKTIGAMARRRCRISWRRSLAKSSEAGRREVCGSRSPRSMTFLKGDFEKAETYTQLGDLLAELDEKNNLGRQCAVLSWPWPTASSAPSPASWARRGWSTQKEGSFRRLIVEKPFGHDLDIGQGANACLLKYLKEEQIYRIDHFLGKETVQNIMALRFANGLFEPIWNRDRIDHVQITVAESIGIESRGNFYEKTGALRDMVPNHLFQLVAMTAMEPPVSFDAEDIRAKKAEMFKAVHPLTLGDVVRGQYDAGMVAGQQVPAYRAEDECRAGIQHRNLRRACAF